VRLGVVRGAEAFRMHGAWLVERGLIRNDLELFLHHGVDIRAVEPSTLLHESMGRDHLRRDELHGPLAKLLTKPRQVEPHLEIPQILGREARSSVCRMSARPS
jgi:hypothetical protein